MGIGIESAIVLPRSYNKAPVRIPPTPAATPKPAGLAPSAVPATAEDAVAAPAPPNHPPKKKFLLSELLPHTIAACVTLCGGTSARRRKQFFAKWQKVMPLNIRKATSLVDYDARRAKVIRDQPLYFLTTR